jgi:hypothetical protein
VRATACIEESVAQLKHPEPVVEIRTGMERLAEERIAVYDRASGALFSGDPDAAVGFGDCAGVISLPLGTRFSTRTTMTTVIELWRPARCGRAP